MSFRNDGAFNHKLPITTRQYDLPLQIFGSISLLRTQFPESDMGFAVTCQLNRCLDESMLDFGSLDVEHSLHYTTVQRSDRSTISVEDSSLCDNEIIHDCI